MQEIGKRRHEATSEYYQTLIAESTYIQRALSGLSSLLSPLYLLQLTELTAKTFSIKEMQEVKVRICEMMAEFKQHIFEDLSIINEIVKSAKRVGTEFQQLVELMREEGEKSSYVVMQLQNQLKFKDLEIIQCEQVMKAGEKRSECEQWKKNYYLKNNCSVSVQKSEKEGSTYLKVLRNIKGKIEMQLAQERKEFFVLSGSVRNKLEQFKVRLINIWDTLPNYFEAQRSRGKSGRFTQNRYHQNKVYESSEVEKLYVNRERQIDEFSLSRLNELRNKLKLLQKAEMRQEKELLYSESVDELVQESAVKQLGEV